MLPGWLLWNQLCDILEVMKRALIDQKQCTACQPCPAEEICERKAIFRECSDDRPWVDFYLCVGCLKCLAVCPAHAVKEIAQPCNGGPRIGW
ncbi:MAG: 4Fe-4S binding protein [Armatimonadota bacterium]